MIRVLIIGLVVVVFVTVVNIVQVLAVIFRTLPVFLRCLSWFDGSGLGFSLEYPKIGLHAISRDVSAYPQEHLYVMVNGKLTGESNTLIRTKMSCSLFLVRTIAISRCPLAG